MIGEIRDPLAQGPGAAIAGTMGGLGQGLGGMSQNIADARLQAAAVPGGMGNPRHAMNHLQGVTLDGKNGTPQYRQGEFQGRDGQMMPQQVQLERSIVRNDQGGDTMGNIKNFIIGVFVLITVVLGLFVLPRMNNKANEPPVELAPEPVQDPLAVLEEGRGLTADQVTDSLEKTLQSDFKADLGDEDQLSAFVTTAEVPKSDASSSSSEKGVGEGEGEGEGAAAAEGDEETAATGITEDPETSARDSLTAPKVTQDLEARLAKVSAATKILRDEADGFDAKLSDQFRKDIEEQKKAHAEKLKNAELQLKQLQAIKERDEAIAAAKVHEKEHATHLVCADTERHLQEDYIEHYSCRFNADNTAPNPLVAYSVKATMSDGKQNDVEAEQEARKKDAATHVTLDAVAVALYLEAWASANSDKLGLDEAPGHDEMVAPVKGFVARDDYQIAPPPAKPKPKPKPAPAPKARAKPAPAPKVVPKPANWVDPKLEAAGKEAEALRAMQQNQQVNPQQGAAMGFAQEAQQQQAAGQAPAAAAAAEKQPEDLSEAEWMAKYGPQGTEGMPAPVPVPAAVVPEDEAAPAPAKKKGMFGFGRHLLKKDKGKRDGAAAAPAKPKAVLRYADAKKGPGTYYSINVFAGNKGSNGDGVRATMDAATVMRALHIPGIANFWGGAQAATAHAIAGKLAAYNKDGDTARFSSFQPGNTHLITATLVDVGVQEMSTRVGHQPVMSVAGVQSAGAPGGATKHTVHAPAIHGASALAAGGYPLISVVDKSLDTAEAVKALDDVLKTAELPAVVFSSVTDCIKFAWDFANTYPYRVYAVSPGHKGSRKAVLLRLDQDTSSPAFVTSMGTDRAVTLIAVSKGDSFDEWASRTGHVSCDCNKKACRAPVGAEYLGLMSLRHAEEEVKEVGAGAVDPRTLNRKDEKGARRMLLRKRGKEPGEKKPPPVTTTVAEKIAPDFCEETAKA